MASPPNDEVLFQREGALGHITLNRPQALNALNATMVTALSRQLVAWAADPAVLTVLIDAVPGRAFCAGGDLRVVYQAAKSGIDALPFFATEYRLNAAINTYPKPYVALLDGIVMGGGAGISVHGSQRVVTENALFAMPETGIGFFCDIGASYFLPRCPGQIGTYLGLTGSRIAGADMIYAGLATHYVAARRLGEIAPRLAAGETPQTLLDGLAEPVPPAPLAGLRAGIDRAFAASTVEAIIDGLAREAAWGQETQTVLAGRSPTSLKIVLKELRSGKRLDIANAMRMEYRLVARMLKGHDFYEGIRAVLIDRDNRPAWHPAALVDIADGDIAEYFAPLAEGELAL